MVLWRSRFELVVHWLVIFYQSGAEILILREREIGRWKSDGEGLPISAIRKVGMNLCIKNLTQTN